MGVFMSTQRQQAYGIGRLESKSAKAAIVQKIATDFNLMPIIAEAYYKQISSYFEQHANVQLTSGQICYEVVAADEPAGKHIALTRKVSCRLTLNDVNSGVTIKSTSLAGYGKLGLPDSVLTISNRFSKSYRNQSVASGPISIVYDVASHHQSTCLPL